MKTYNKPQIKEVSLAPEQVTLQRINHGSARIYTPAEPMS